MVQPETASWLNESRGSFGAAQSRFNDISSMDVADAGALFMSAEYAVKAVIVEHYGCLPPSVETRRALRLSHLLALWSADAPPPRTPPGDRPPVAPRDAHASRQPSPSAADAQPR